MVSEKDFLEIDQSDTRIVADCNEMSNLNRRPSIDALSIGQAVSEEKIFIN